MLDQEQINQQLALLVAHRRTLSHLLHQAAQYGGTPFTPPVTANGIAEARMGIHHAKAALRAAGVAVDDLANDEAPLAPAVQPQLGMRRAITNDGKFIGLDQSKLIDFNNATIRGGVNIGRISHGNITEINVSIVSPDDIAKAHTTQAAVALIIKFQDEVAALTDAPKDKRQDATNDLRKAREAGQEGDRDRLLEKLKSAQEILFTLGGTIPAARKLSETISALIQRMSET